MWQSHYSWTFSCAADPPESNSDYLCYLCRWPLKGEDKENKLCGRLQMWFVIFCSCKETYEGKKTASAPTLVLSKRCHSFKDWGLQTVQKCNTARWQPARCSLNVNKWEIVHGASECQLIKKLRLSRNQQLHLSNKDQHIKHAWFLSLGLLF